MKTIVQKIKVPFEYPVHFTHGLFNSGNSLLVDTLNPDRENAVKVLMIVDGGIVSANPDILCDIKHWFEQHTEQITLIRTPIIVPGGENAKNGWSNVLEIMRCAAIGHLDRHGYIVAMGGGAVLDMAGFAAALIHRGVRLVRLPSTVLAQNDAGIGIKNGMNEGGAKNFIGSFAPPFAVINDFELLKSLPQRDWISGVAEAFKVALIADLEFFRWLCANADQVAARDQRTMEKLVYTTAKLHLNHIASSGDPFETGNARPLDFGHWAGHRLELISNFSISHGEGVAIGIALDCAYAMLQNFITPSDFQSVVRALKKCGLPVYSGLLERMGTDGKPSVFQGLEQFREHLGGELCVTLPRPIGDKVEVHQMNMRTLKEALDIVQSL
jgi:3-dehydroquinate synthase